MSATGVSEIVAELDASGLELEAFGPGTFAASALNPDARCRVLLELFDARPSIQRSMSAAELGECSLH